MARIKKQYTGNDFQGIVCGLCGIEYKGTQQRVDLLMRLHEKKSHNGEVQNLTTEKVDFDVIRQKVSKKSELHEAFYRN